jgi:RimJ/RimL family protein N-acetyltransferase
MEAKIPFKLRKWRNDDVEDLVRFANNVNISRNLTNHFVNPYTIENGRSFLNMVSEQHPVQIFAIEVENHASGSIGIHPQSDIMLKNAELGYWLAECYWGNNIISSAIVKMVDYAFQTFDIDRIFARPFGSNVGSQKALIKAGFVQEAYFKNTIYKNNQYEDELVFAIRRK